MNAYENLMNMLDDKCRLELDELDYYLGAEHDLVPDDRDQIFAITWADLLDQ